MSKQKATSVSKQEEAYVPNVFIISKDHILISANNKRAEVLNNTTPENVIGKSMYELHPKHIAEQFIANNKVVMETEKEHTFEEEAIVEGKHIRLAVLKRPFYVRDKVFGVIGVSTVIEDKEESKSQSSDFKAATENFLGKSILSMASINQKITGEINTSFSTNPEDYLLRAQGYFESLIAAIPIHVYWMDRQGSYLGCSDLQAKTSGLASREEIIGKTNVELHLNYNGTKPEILDSVNEEVMSSGVAKTLEEPGTPAEGPKSAYLSTKAPLFDEKGVVIGMLGASMSITHQKEAENLRIAKERSEAADQLKTDFVANVCHDLSKPVNFIEGAIQLLKTGDLSPVEVERKYELMEHASDVITRMVEDISDVAKIEKDTLSIKPRLVDLSSFIKSIEAQVHHYKKKDTDFQTDVFFDLDKPFYAYLDGVRLFQVLLNLLTNSCKAISGSGSIILSVHLKDKHLLFSVKDTGIGIPEEKLKIVFKRFTKLNQHIPGKGIGLSISQRIVELMGGGDTHVNSTIGEGSIFSFSIPYVSKEETGS